MDPARFPVSSTPLNHAQYGPITDENLKGINQGKVAVVTGGARGIGRAISTKLALSGANVAVLDRLEDQFAETKKICEAFGGTVKTYVVDVTDVQALRGVLDLVEQEVGQVDILVNNAGVSPGKPQWMESFDEFWRTIEINFKATMVTTWHMLPKFRDRGRGVIVNISSRAATVDFPFAVGYTSSKAAVARATGTLQEEIDLDGLGDRIMLYALHPGGVPTDMAKKEVQKELYDKYPALTQHGTDFQALFKDPPELCGATCAYLGAGKANELRGMYWDCRQDIEKVKAYGRERLLKEGKYTLTMDFLDGYENEP